ncbi:MAG: purine-nucleoside phosphorylase [Ignavibacteria bacterium]|nr:purine-nucleoside phosphorylase [Ignavibacteria bacterium]
MSELQNNINDALKFIRTKTSMKPTIGIILGTGLGKLAKEITNQVVIEYEHIPHFPVSTVESHHGKLIFGKLAGKNVVAMQGRFHKYEGYTLQQVTFPVRVMKFLGVKSLLISCAAGGLNPMFRKGDIEMLVDHINLLGDNPLIGTNDDSLGLRFPDMSEPYSKKLQALAEHVALDLKLPLQKGVHVSVAGPNLETRAEYRFLRMIGADSVGMSTIPENIVAVHMGMEVLAFAIITDECFPDSLKPVSLKEVIGVADKAEPKLTAMMKEVVKRMK